MIKIWDIDKRYSYCNWQLELQLELHIDIKYKTSTIMVNTMIHDCKPATELLSNRSLSSRPLRLALGEVKVALAEERREQV